MEPFSEEQPRAARWWPLALLAMLCAFHLFANLWWLGADNHVIRGDEESHMEYAREYYEVLAVNEYSNVVQRIVALGNIRPKTMSHPPLLHLLGGLQLAVFGYGVDVLSFTGTYLFLLAIVGVYLLARRMVDAPEAVFAAAVFSCTPMVFSASRFFMTDFVAMTVTVWACYALLRSDGFRHTGWVLLFALLNGLGLLSRSVNFLYLLAPAALIFGYGLYFCLQALDTRLRLRRLRTLFVHGLLTIVVTLGVAAPWYFRHAESIYDFWVTYRTDVTGTPLAGLDAAQIPKVPPVAEPGSEPEQPAPSAEEPKSVVPAAQPAEVAPPTEPGLLIKLYNRFIYPPNPWIDYPVHLINNALFLPYTVLALLGLACAWFSKRFRRVDFLLYLVWVLGAYLFLQMTLRWSTPRYALQVLPALALFAAFAVLALPRLPRRIAMIAVGLWCALQFVNMTFYSPAALQRVEVPVVLSAEVQGKYSDGGLVVLKDMVSASNAYRRMGTPETYNYKDEIFGALVRAETTGPTRAGEFANFARLRMLGMDWDQEHYWPEPNPYLRPDLPKESIPRRKLRSVALQSEPAALDPYVDTVDYIVYRAFSAEQEAAWIAHFLPHEFAPIHQYQEPAIGADPPGWYGVLQKGGGTALDLTSTESVATLNIYALHDLINTPSFAFAKQAVQRAARKRYAELLKQYQAFELTSQVSLLNADIAKTGAGTFRARYLLKVTQDIERDVGIYLIGRVAEEHYSLLPPEVQGKRNYFDWHTQPSPPTSQWKKGSVLVITQDFDPKPIPHSLMMGLETFSGDLVGRGIDLGVVDFGSIP